MERYYNINALTKNDKNRQFTNRYIFISFGKLESLETQKPKKYGNIAICLVFGLAFDNTV